MLLLESLKVGDGHLIVGVTSALLGDINDHRGSE